MGEGAVKDGCDEDKVKTEKGDLGCGKVGVCVWLIDDGEGCEV